MTSRKMHLVTMSFAAAAILLLGLLPTPAHALKFANQFVEFELPFKWNCALEGAEWVCQSTDENKKRDAIIILAAKLKGDQDTLDRYQEYLTKPRVFNAPNGKPVTSQAKYAKISKINDHPWVDSIHMESEIPGFYTRYLATVKQDIGVLVTYSINKSKYQEYLTQFEDMVKSLKVFRKSGGVNSNPNGSLFSQVQVPSALTQQQVFPETQSTEPSKEKQKKAADKEQDSTMLLFLVGAAVLGFIFYKKRQARR